MARICPSCRRMTAGEEQFCPHCAQPTVEPGVYQAMRAIEERQQPAPSPESAAAAAKAELPSAEQQEAWVKMGVGGMLAVLLFFVVYLLAYLTYF